MEDLAPTETQIAFSETARRCAQACQGKDARAVTRILGEAGLIGALANEETGGLELGLRDLLPLAIEWGRSGPSFPLVEAMLAASVAARMGGDFAGAVLSGAKIVTLGWHGSVSAAKRQGQYLISGVVTHVTGAGHADWVVARLAGGDAEGVVLFPRAAAGLTSDCGNDLDHSGPECDLTLSEVKVNERQVILDEGLTWQQIMAAGDILRSAAMYGAALGAFEAACRHTSQRVQFGRPLSANQSVRHRLARDYHGLESVRLSLEQAAAQTDADGPDVNQPDVDQLGAELARDVLCGLAGEICARVAEDAIQLHGALGYTTDMPLHRWLRRILVTSGIRPSFRAREDLAARLIHSWREAS